MTFYPQCIITGCDILFPDINKRTHGDLFVLGSSYILNAIYQKGGPVLLETDNLADKYVEFNFHSNMYFERRGVFVIHKSKLKFSPAAQSYLNLNQ